MSELLLDETLPIELTNENQGQGKRWYNSANVRKAMEVDLAEYVLSPFDCKTRVVVTRILGPKQKLWDASSILRGNYKQIEDALVCLGWWVDDGPRYITKVEGEQDDTKRDKGPAVRIQVYRS